jgi:hypothetical protein
MSPPHGAQHITRPEGIERYRLGRGTDEFWGRDPFPTATCRHLWSLTFDCPSSLLLIFVAFTDHLILKRTGTTKDNLLSGMSLGGTGIGWARASMASVS